MEDRMTSKLVVNTIEADTGISSVSFASSISMSSTSEFFFSAAGVTIGSDTNINRPAAGVIGFNINSSEKARITSAGNLALGNDGSFPIYTDTNDRNFILGTGSDDTAIQIHSGSDKYGGVYFGDATSGGNRYRGYVEFKHGTSDDYLRFAAGGTERLRITKNGAIQNFYNTSLPVTDSRPILQLGYGVIGDDSSGYNAVTCNAYPVSGDSSWHYIGSSSLGASRYHIGFGDHKWFTASAGTRGNDITWLERLRIDSNGRVLINTSTAGEATSDSLTIQTRSNHAGVTIRSSTSGSGCVYFADGTSGNAQYRGFVEYVHSSDYLKFGTSASERLRITSDGKVSIGGFTPAVAGLSIANSSTSLGFEFDTGSGFASGPTIRGYHRPSSAYKQLGITGADIRFGINDVEKMRLDSGGKLLLGDTNTAWNATSNGYKMTIKESSSENAAILFMDTDSMAGGVAGISKGTNQILSGTTNVDFVVGSLYADTHIIYGVGSDQNGRIGATINTSGQFLVGTTTASDSGNKFESHSSTGYNIVAKSTNGNGGFHNFTGRASNNTITSYISHNGRGYFEDGVQFDSSGESLRSYEEGTFTPSYRSSSNPTVGYQNQDGIYRKIGNIVYYQIYIRINSKSGGSGNLYIDNLPFTAHGTGYGGAGGILYVNAWGGNAPTNLMVGSGSTILYLYGGGLSGGTSLNLYPSDIGTSSQLRINGTYLAA